MPFALCRARQQHLQVIRAQQTGEIGLSLCNALYRLDDEESDTPNRPLKWPKRESTVESGPLSSKPQNDFKDATRSDWRAHCGISSSPESASSLHATLGYYCIKPNTSSSQFCDERSQDTGASLSQPDFQSAGTEATSSERVQSAAQPPAAVSLPVTTQSTSSHTMDDLFAAARLSKKPAQTERLAIESPTAAHADAHCSQSEGLGCPVCESERREEMGTRADIIEVAGEPDVKKTREHFLAWCSDVLCKENQKADKELFDKYGKYLEEEAPNRSTTCMRRRWVGWWSLERLSFFEMRRCSIVSAHARRLT
ncbi:hypothetical protein PENSPDRAFT_671837 [Peniophora sp. CONT]|nr:hypothetical protein PENSPDRAFT_671837 [Peniophora sp. CONT]